MNPAPVKDYKTGRTLEMSAHSFDEWCEWMVEQGYFDRGEYDKGIIRKTPAGEKYLQDGVQEMIGEGRATSEALAAMSDVVKTLADLPEEQLDEVMLRLLEEDPNYKDQIERARGGKK